MKTNNIPVSYIHLNTSIVVTTSDGEVHTVDATHPNWGVIIEAIDEQRLDDLEELVDVQSAVNSYVSPIPDIEVSGGEITWKGYSVDNYLTDVILRLMNEGRNVDPLINHLDKLMQNPSSTSVRELYRFLEVGQLPLCPDGDFLAYKYVRANYTDCHSGKFDNSVGATPTMPRSQVDDNRDRTCSRGLHFCSKDYLDWYGSGDGRIMIVKVNPRDVVSIPADHSNQKARCCTYEVVGELNSDYTFSDMEENAVLDDPRKRPMTRVEAYVRDGRAALTIREIAKNLRMTNQEVLKEVPDRTYLSLQKDDGDHVSPWTFKVV